MQRVQSYREEAGQSRTSAPSSLKKPGVGLKDQVKHVSLGGWLKLLSI